MAIRAATTLGYDLTADVQKYTRATLTGPTVVKRRSLVILRGWIHGVMNPSAGASARRAKMLLLAGDSGYKTLGAVFLGPRGKFTYFWRPQRVGVASLRVVYFGGAHYLPTRATHSLRVTK